MRRANFGSIAVILCLAAVVSGQLASRPAATEPAATQPTVGPDPTTLPALRVDDVDEEFIRDFDPANARLSAAVLRPQGTTAIRVDVAPGIPHSISISLLKDDKVIYRFGGHEYTDFIIDVAFPSRDDESLCYTDYRSDSPGGAIVNVDLRTRQQLWRTELESIPGDHSASPYSNRIGLKSFYDEQVIVVLRQETAGKCMELIDARTGKIFKTHFYGPHNEK